MDQALSWARRALESSAAGTDFRAMAIGDLGNVLTAAGRDDEARAAFREGADAFRRLGQGVNEAITRSKLAELDLFVGDYESARTGAARALAAGRETGHRELELMATLYTGEALLGLGRLAEARAALSSALDLIGTVGGQAVLLYLALGAAALVADPERIDDSARLRGATATLRRTAGLDAERRQAAFEQTFEQTLIDALSPQAWAQAQAQGAAMTLDEALALARSLCET